jgi:hypothetical protein
VATFVVQVLESFLANKELIEALRSCLAIVEPARVRLRPPVSWLTILRLLTHDRAVHARVGGFHMTARRNLKNFKNRILSRSA